MVDADGQGVVVGKPQVVEKNLGLRAGVVKNQRCAVAAHLFQNGGDRVFRPAACPWRIVLGFQHGDIWRRTRIGVEDFARVGVAGHEPRDGVRVVHRGRQPDPPQVRADRLKSRQGQHQLIAALAFGQGVDFVDDDPLQPREHARRVFVGRQQCKAFRCGQQDMRRVGALAFLATGGGVAGAVLDTDRQGHVGNRAFQIAPDIGGKRLERRDIERV